MVEERARLVALISAHAPLQVAVGAGGISLFAVDTLDTQQLGYARDRADRDLTGPADGDWRASWLVVGRDDGTGDPLFVDLRDSRLPVFTAAHGTGAWSPVLVAESIAVFLVAMRAIERLSRGRTNPILLAANPLTNGERNELARALADLGADAETQFWTAWFEAALE